MSISRMTRILVTVLMLSLGGCGGGGTGTATGGSGTSTITRAEAARFLAQATFGATIDDINALVNLGSFQQWINRQFSNAAQAQLPYVKERHVALGYSASDVETFLSISRHHIWWDAVINSDAQLRHRVAYALSQIFVVSEQDPNLAAAQYAVTDYYDMLAKNAFGNYRDLMKSVTLHPAMGAYLSMLRNEKADPARNIRPDENFAREMLQLFSIGVHKLNIDGTVRTNARGEPIPTYDEELVREFARVFTGWTFADSQYWWSYPVKGATTRPMEAWEEYHDTGEKRLFNGRVLPAGQTAIQDLNGALSNIFNHANVGPFVSKQLIQRLVTSNPSPAYVQRVAETFNDNGSGERGDMKAVIVAILLDAEAREGQTSNPDFGKLREPLLRISHLWRALKAQKVDGGEWFQAPGEFVYRIPQASLPGFGSSFGQGILSAPSVFNFYRPDYAPTGPVTDKSLVAPEFQVLNENTAAKLLNALNWQLQQSHTNNTEYWTTFDLRKQFNLADDHDALLDHLRLVLMSGKMSSQMRDILLDHMQNANFPPGEDGVQAMVKDVISLIISSPEYMIQR